MAAPHDGPATRLFNGFTPLGTNNDAPGVLVWANSNFTREAISLDNASLASLLQHQGDGPGGFLLWRQIDEQRGLMDARHLQRIAGLGGRRRPLRSGPQARPVRKPLEGAGFSVGERGGLGCVDFLLHWEPALRRLGQVNAFYRHHGFMPILSRPRTLFLPMAMVGKAR